VAGSPRRGRRAQQKPAVVDLLAKGGGSAPASGVGFQAALGALFASLAIGGRQLDSRLELGDARVRSLRFETEAPLDDLLVERSDGGFIFVQAKSGLTLSSRHGGELAKVADQVVRQWHACAMGDGKRGWDRPTDRQRDRFVIAVDPTTSGRVQFALASALALKRRVPVPEDVVSKELTEVLNTFSALLTAAWVKVIGSDPEPAAVDAVLHLVWVLPYDLQGTGRDVAHEVLRDSLEDKSSAAAAFSVLADRCDLLMKQRSGDDPAGFLHSLGAAGLRVLSSPEYRADVDALLRASVRVHQRLSQHEVISLGTEELRIARACTATVVDALQRGSLVIVGEPGAGKSAVVNVTAETLRGASHDVVQLAIDDLQVEGLDGLRTELGLTHPLREVLANWPGAAPAFLVIDALDASRGSPAEAVFRTVISDVLSLKNSRWRVLASIRSFDLRLGQQFRSLFAGPPAAADYADSTFPDVRHVYVPALTEEELDELLARAPALRIALAAGGDRVRDLARVPFNMRLLAELVSTEVAPAELKSLGTQADLLKLYWRRRIERHGPAAEVCLRTVVDEMIAVHALRAPYLAPAQADPAALEQLMRDGVLLPLNGNRHVAFRHHILFDYAASRLFLDPHDLAALRTVLARQRGLGLLLAPALGYALQELWAASNQHRAPYWSTIAALANDSGIDPIARSVVARSACELPRHGDDVVGLVALLGEASSHKVLSQVLSALAVRLEDSPQLVPSEPWGQLTTATSASPSHQESARFLLWLFSRHPDASRHQAMLGSSARSLLQVAFSQGPGDYSPRLVKSAIEFVADTYASNPPASRALLQRVLTPERFSLNAHHEIPALVDRIAGIASVDPEFAVAIYAEVFARDVISEEPTTLGQSQILALTSTARQDYGMARYQLKEHFPHFLAADPAHAAVAMVRAIEGYVANEYPIEEGSGSWDLVLPDGTALRLQEDGSSLWASDPDSTHGDEPEQILLESVRFIRQGPPEAVLELSEHLLQSNRLAVIWARLLMVGAERTDLFADLLWPIAIQEPFLLCEDTRKDAIDFIAAVYPTRSIEDRSALENRAQDLDWGRFRRPEVARASILGRLFGRIGQAHVTTDLAREIVASQSEEAPPGNERPIRFTSSVGPPEDWWWLRAAGVDIASPGTRALLLHANRVEAALGLRSGEGQPPIADLAAALAQLDELEHAMRGEEQRGAASLLLAVPGGVLARGCAAIAMSGQDQRVAKDVIDAAVAMTIRLTQHPHPEGGPEVEQEFDKSPSWGSPAPRIQAAEDVMRFCRTQNPPSAALLTAVETLLRDRHPAVRLMVVQQLGVLWNIDRALMWRLAETVARNETNRSVILGLTNGLLAPARTADPEHVESLVLILRDRFANEAQEEDSRSRVCEAIGSLLALLWVESERGTAHAVVQGWLIRLLEHSAELGAVVGVLRDSLVLGYDSASAPEEAIRRRGQELVAQIVEAAAGALTEFLAASRASQLARADEARSLARLLDHAFNQLYFASGAANRSGQEERGLHSVAERSRFLLDLEATLRRVGDVGTPRTIHYLLELLKFLVTADPPRVFDLTAHALLEGGRRHGYQHESLGVTSFVNLVGVFLADHRGLFVEESRRKRLIDCVDAFIQAGWPEARRLLYRLPELLQ
jgi:hypothetical protein